MARPKQSRRDPAKNAKAVGVTTTGEKAKSPAQDIFVDYGITGVPFTEGIFGDRQPPELQGQAGILRMAEMMRKEPAVWTTQNMITLSARQALWSVEPGSDKPADKEVAEIITGMMDDMSTSWWDAIQFALSAKAFGFADLHTVYKRRMGAMPKNGAPSKYEDQLIGLRKLAIRRQETIIEWQQDEHGDMKAMVQENPNDGQRYEPVPIDRLLHFRGGDGRGSWEGIGWLEPAYKLYYQLEKYELIMGIGHQRAHMGLPVFKYLKTPDTATKTAIETLGRNLTVNQQGYITYPGDFVEFDLKSVVNGNGSELRELINQLRWEIMTLGLTQFFRLGTTASGSRALADPLVRQFERSIDAALDDICIVLNRHLMPRILQVNPTLASKVSGEPRFKASTIASLPVETLEFLDKIANFLSVAGPEDQLWLRGLVDMPKITVKMSAIGDDPEAKNDGASIKNDKAKDSPKPTATEKHTNKAAPSKTTKEDKDANLSELLNEREQALVKVVAEEHVKALNYIQTPVSNGVDHVLAR